MLVLASASPRRQELLRNAGFEFAVQPANISEELQEGEKPKAFAERLACKKALAVFQQWPNDIILGADTIVIVQGEILGKPRDNADAERMLKLLSGRTHQVTTGVCIVGPLGNQLETGNQKLETIFCDARSETTSVIMAPLSDEDIRAYVVTQEPSDKAGAYGIQGIASRWISRIEGDYFNVVGLPVSLVYRMLHEHGVV
jgi:septum formation protein